MSTNTPTKVRAERERTTGGAGMDDSLAKLDPAATAPTEQQGGCAVMWHYVFPLRCSNRVLVHTLRGMSRAKRCSCSGHGDTNAWRPRKAARQTARPRQSDKEALLHAAEVLHEAQEGDKFGVKVASAEMDMDGLQSY